MKERFNAPPAPSAEKIPSPEVIPLDETEVVANLHISHSKVLSGEMLANEKLLTDIREDLGRLECYPMYREYTAERVPTFGILRESANRAVKNIEQLLAADKASGVDTENTSEELKIQKLLAGRADSIKRSVNDYIQTIIRFHNLRRLSHGGSRDVTEQFVKADESRRRAHENLLKSLNIFTTAAKQAEEAGLLAAGNTVEWMPDMDAKSLIERPEAVVVFSESTLKNRDYIKDWAIAADFDLQLREMLDAQKNSPEAAKE